MKPRAIWMFAGGPMQELACRRIVEQGYELILTDRDPSCACAPLAAELVELDTFDIPGALEAATGLDGAFQIAAVMTAAADCHWTVAEVARKLGLPGIDPRIAELCRMKHLGRKVLADHGVRQPRALLAGSHAEAILHVTALGGTATLKATDNSGSRGFARVGSPDEVTEEAFERAREAGTTGQVIVEELLRPAAGPIAEQSVETLWADGTMYWLNWVDRLFGRDCSGIASLSGDAHAGLADGIEVGHVNPAMHDRDTKAAVRKVVEGAGVALGMGTQRGAHILKADIMLTAEGPVILELTPRLSGGWDSSGSTPARGGDFVGGAIALALGEPLDLTTWHRHFELTNAEQVSAVMATIPDGAVDCIGRRFAMGVAHDRDAAIAAALERLEKGLFDVSVEQ